VLVSLAAAWEAYARWLANPLLFPTFSDTVSALVRTIARRVDRLAVVFPFEPALYADRACAVEFVGHPLLDRVVATHSREATLAQHGLATDRPLVFVLPGSRRTEIERILPSMLEAVQALAEDPRRQFALGLAPTVSRPEVEALVERFGVPMPVIAGDTYDLMAAADLALVTSGTATLECALLECPMIVVYPESDDTELVCTSTCTYALPPRMSEESSRIFPSSASSEYGESRLP
jgi:lipid-A-disaccharide synthase